MAEFSELPYSCEIGKEWSIKWSNSNSSYGQQSLSYLLQQIPQWIQSPTFTLPLLSGSWIVVLVRDGGLVYAQQDGKLALRQSNGQYGRQRNSGYYNGTQDSSIVLIHLHDEGPSEYPEKKLEFYASILDAQNQKGLEETKLALAGDSFTDQTIRFCSLQAQRYVTVPLKLKIFVKLGKLEQNDLNAPVATAQPADPLENNNKLIDLLLSPAVSDVTFVLQNGQILYAHQSLLAASSPVFAAMFATKMKESEMKLVEIEDASIEAFRHFIRYFYANRIDEMPLRTHVTELLYLSDKYNLAPLKDDCNRYLLKTSIEIDNCISFYITADKFGLDVLKTKVFSFMKTNSKQLTSSPQWQKLMKSNQALALELAVRMLQESKNPVPASRERSNYGSILK